MALASTRPARLANWRIGAFDKTQAGQAGLERLQALLGLSRDTIRRRMRDAKDSDLAKVVFMKQWPTAPSMIAESAKRALDLGLAPDLAEILACPTQAVRKALAAAHGNTGIGKALAALGKTATAPATDQTLTAPARPRAAVKPRSPLPPTPSPTTWQAGFHVGGIWQLDGTSRQGGFATAWPAVGPAGRRAWVKRPHPGQGPQRAHLREIDRLKRLKHPNIVALLDESPNPADPWLVVEDGGNSMKDAIAAHAMSLGELLNWLAPAARALDHAHLNDLVHQDVNPGNIVRDNRGTVLLLDFGTVANLVPGQNSVGLPTSHATSAVGWHPGFAAPETMLGKSRKASDQFALCAIGLAALAGRPDGYVRVEHVQHLLSPAVVAVFRQATAHSPRDRFGSCQDFVAALVRASRSK